jgi:hypothetical protein
MESSHDIQASSPWEGSGWVVGQFDLGGFILNVWLIPFFRYYEF